MPVKPIPEGFHSITPYLVAERVARLLDFLTQAFGAQVTERMQRPDGSVMHAQVRIGDSMLTMWIATHQEDEPCGQMSNITRRPWA